MNIWYKWSIAFNLNLFSFFTEMSFIQNKARKIISEEDAME